MRSLCLLVLLGLSAVPVAAQRKALLFTGRFPFTSLDDVNERAGGSITKLEEFDISIVTPDATGPFVARTFWLTSTAMQTLGGDAYNDNNYTRFFGFKTAFENWNFCAPFVKVADQANCTWDKVYWTVRDAVAKNFRVLTANGTSTVTITPGDCFRFDKNGNVEFFITQALIMTAAGMQTGTHARGADGICQDAAGNLYYSPAQGGHQVVNDPTVPPVHRNDGTICMIRAQDITYDARGNVQAVVASSAFAIFDEIVGNGSTQPSVRQMMVNSGAVNNAGAPILLSNNMVGLALDPNGGTLMASIPRGPSSNPVFETVPNMIWVDDGGTYAATVWSTLPGAITPTFPGSIAVINGVTMGSIAPNPATGAYWGVRQDLAAFQPTTMGLAVIDHPAIAPFVADAPNHGAIRTTDVNIDWDFYAGPGTLVAATLSVGPLAPGQAPFGIDASFLLGPDSFRCVFGLTSQIASFVLGVTNPGGYANMSFPRPTQGGLTGLTLIVHGIKFTGTPPGFAVSNPVISQFK